MPKSKLTRRQVLITTAALATPLGLACGGDVAPHATDPTPPSPPAPPAPPPPGPPVDAAAPTDASPPVDAGPPKPLSVRGVVVEVSHAGAVLGRVVQPAPVRQIMTRAMLELTGQATETAAWRAFFGPQDVVGIKVNPFGYPKFFSQIATVGEIIRGLNLAGVPNQNILVFDRYTEMLNDIGYPAALPAGIRFASAISTAGFQTDLTSFDVNEFVEFPKVETGNDIQNPIHRRSYLSNFASNAVTKIVNVPVLKDHASAGITFALKNLTYGLVNNTARTHDIDNWTAEFVPKVAAMPKLRDKVVLHIGDALIASYDGGPDPNDNIFERKSLIIGTDAVAIDRIAWKIIDEERAKIPLPLVAADPARQPEYILACGAAGLGESNLAVIQHRQLTI